MATTAATKPTRWVTCSTFDVKKLGWSPDCGGWRARQDRANHRFSNRKLGFDNVRVDDHTRLVDAEC